MHDLYGLPLDSLVFFSFAMNPSVQFSMYLSMYELPHKYSFYFYSYVPYIKYVTEES